MSAIGNALITRPVVSYGGLSALLATAALGPTPAPLPLIALIGVLRLASRQLARRPGGIWRLSTILLAVAVGGSARHMTPALSATSSAFTSILSLYVLNLASGAVAFTILYLDAQFSSRINNNGSQTLFFPALWASGWALASSSPVGRLFAWSPVAQDMGPFGWLTPYLGPIGFDWIIASGAVILSEVVGTMLMGSPMEVEEEDVQSSEDLLISTNLADNYADTATAVQNRESSCVAASGRTVRYSAPFRRPMWVLSVFLVALALPSYMVDNMPLSPISSENLSITVGCVLPSPVQGQPPQLEHFISESKTLVESKVLIWPEGAVHFNSEKDRNDTLAHIRSEVFKSKANAWIGVSFEETLKLQTSDERYKNRNGFVLMSNTSEDHIYYYKRNLVPIAESFKMIAGTEPPSLVHINVPEKKTRKGRQNVPVAVTAGICMDFASAGPFSGLSERPGLVLAPARTWHPAAGRAMWSQAQARADEIGASALLWCDGGEGGLSGVAGVSVGPNGRLMRAGPGSWQADVAIPKAPAQPTFYARRGDLGALQLVWVLVGLGALLESGIQRAATLNRRLPGLPRQLGRLIAYIQEKRRASTQRLQGERTPLLIDV